MGTNTKIKCLLWALTKDVSVKLMPRETRQRITLAPISISVINNP